MDEQQLSERAAHLRASFDSSFAESPRQDRDQRDSYLCIRCAGDRYAIDLRQIAGLHQRKQIRPLPGPLRELLGIAGFRGALVPVYDLAALLGYARNTETPRWMVVADAGRRFALAFDDLEDYVQTGVSLSGAEDAAARRAHVRGTLSDAAGLRALLDLTSLARAIGALVEALADKE
jgi:chemotaxis signal transduction protein